MARRGAAPSEREEAKVRFNLHGHLSTQQILTVVIQSQRARDHSVGSGSGHQLKRYCDDSAHLSIHQTIEYWLTTIQSDRYTEFIIMFNHTTTVSHDRGVQKHSNAKIFLRSMTELIATVPIKREAAPP